MYSLLHSALPFIALIAVVTSCPANVKSKAQVAPKAQVASTKLTGQATYYGGNTDGGACSFTGYTIPSGIYGAALSSSNWASSGKCGACVKVTGPNGNSITAMITDECPGCGANHLDLYPDAFKALDDPDIGIIDVAWSYIDCPITSPIQLVNKSGVSANWFSMQVVNANEAVSTLTVSTDGGQTWQDTQRQDYNFFQISSGTGTTTVDIQLQSASGKVVTVNNVQIASDAKTTAGCNF